MVSSPALSSTSSSSARPGEPQFKGACILTGVAVCSNKHYFNDKQFNKLFDAQLYVRDEKVGDGLLASLRYYDLARIVPDPEIDRAFFVALSVSRPKPNSKGQDISSRDFKLEDYNLVGDVLAAYPITDWSENVVDPNKPPYMMVSGLINHVEETKEELSFHIELENYLQILDGKGSITAVASLDLTSPRWKPKEDGSRRAPWLKAGQYVTATGTLAGVIRDDDSKVTSLKVSADSIVNVGLASRVPVYNSPQTPAPLSNQTNTTDPATPTPNGRHFAMARLKQARDASVEAAEVSTPCPPSKKAKGKQAANNTSNSAVNAKQ